MQNEALESPEQKTCSVLLSDQTVLPLSTLLHHYYCFFLEREISKMVKASKASPRII